MNIFVLDLNPIIAAKMHCDKHVHKMGIELAQMLSTAHHMCSHPNAVYVHKLYKYAYAMHPCTIWVRQSSQNYLWALEHWKALMGEFKDRYGSLHASIHLLEWLQYVPDALKKKGGELTDHAICMPLQYHTPYDPVESYRRYYALGKAEIARWKSGTPQWYIDDIKKFYSEKRK